MSASSEERISTTALIDNRWRISERLGSGGFGQVYSAQDCETRQSYAVKIETISVDSTLEHEKDVYDLLHMSSPGLVGFSKAYYLGEYGDGYQALVLDRLGPCLDDVRLRTSGRLSLRNTINTGFQCLTRLKHIHGKGITHNDIKPENLLMGHGNDRDTVYLIDFGLSSTWLDGETMQHRLQDPTDAKMVGTLPFASLRMHERVGLSRRDDLESLGYVLIFLHTGRLPWLSRPDWDAAMHTKVDISAFNNKYRAVMEWDEYETFEIKRQVALPDLCIGMPMELEAYLVYVKSLGFSDEPDYDYLLSLFEDVYIRIQKVLDCMTRDISRY